MLRFNNFIRDEAEALAGFGIMIVLEEQYYDLEAIFNQAFQEYQTLYPVQRLEFDQLLKAYVERKKKEELEKEKANKKEKEEHKRREQQLEKKYGEQQIDDSNLPIEKMRDSPLKYQKMKETLTIDYVDNSFLPNNLLLWSKTREDFKGWKRPTPDCSIISNK